MKVTVVKETRAFETRVAASPETVKKFKALGAEVFLEKGAGQAAGFPDSAFETAGAAIGTDRAALLKSAAIVLTVRGLDESDAAHIDEDTLVLGMFNPFQEQARVEKLASTGAGLVSLEFVPRITRAQSMDVLSSQSNIAGYRAVLEAAHAYGRMYPMMMTAAGTVAPARVLVMGAGVAGLQAIATAKRLGAIVSATDVRLAAKEQVESLGGTFVMVEDDEVKDAETSGGYAREMSDAYKAKQAELIAETIKKQDIVITTALIPGRPAPRLVSDAMLASMKPGSVVVDIAVEQGGNVEGITRGEITKKYGVTLVGVENLPARLAGDASALYARNLHAYLAPFFKEGAFEIDASDEIVAASMIAKDGTVAHDGVRAAYKGDA